jgi:hypothetical protein
MGVKAPCTGIVSTCAWVARVRACVEGWACVRCACVLDGTCVGVSRSKGVSKCEAVGGNYLPDRCPARKDPTLGQGR